MGWRDVAKDAFRQLLFSPWAMMIVVLFLTGPIFTAISILTGSNSYATLGGSTATAVNIVGQGYFPFLPMLLVALVASGAWAPGPSAMGAFLGRAGVVLLLFIGSWGVPMFLLAASHVGGAATYPALLMVAIHALGLLVWVALLSLAAELGSRSPGISAAGVYLSLSFLIPAVVFGIASIVESDRTWMTFLSPDITMQTLRAATFPRLGFMGANSAGPWPYAGALVAWIAIPVLVLALTDRRAPIDPEFVEA